MLILIALRRVPETSADWMQTRRGKGASYSNPSRVGMEKNTVASGTLTKPEGQGLRGLEARDCQSW